jgi:hypothetical protein
VGSPVASISEESSGLGFRVQGLGFRVYGLGFRLLGFKLKALQDFGL